MKEIKEKLNEIASRCLKCNGDDGVQISIREEVIPLLSAYEKKVQGLIEGCECVQFDVENQDQDPVNDDFRVICDTTADTCIKALTEFKESK
jgi:hypothetical protein